MGKEADLHPLVLGNFDKSKKGAVHPPCSYVTFDIDIKLYKTSDVERKQLYNHGTTALYQRINLGCHDSLKNIFTNHVVWNDKELSKII